MSAHRRSAMLSVVLLLLLPCRGRAVVDHAAIAGSVRHAIGAVPPGVTVGVEPGADRARAHGGHRRAGRLQIVDLRPGTYAVTFSLGGFAP